MKAFTFNLLWNIGLADIYEENSALHRYVILKRKSILMPYQMTVHIL